MQITILTNYDRYYRGKYHALVRRKIIWTDGDLMGQAISFKDEFFAVLERFDNMVDRELSRLGGLIDRIV